MNTQLFSQTGLQATIEYGFNLKRVHYMIKKNTITINKSWFSYLQLENKLVSSQLKFVNDFIHFKLLISNIIKITEYNLMEPFIFNES